MKQIVRAIDGQGRILIPAHIRAALGVDSGSSLEIELEDDGTIRIFPPITRCAICGEKLEGKPSLQINAKKVCQKCADRIAKERKSCQ